MVQRKEGYTLGQVRIELDGQIVGGAQSLSFERAGEKSPQGEAGSNITSYILDGPVTITGTLEKHSFDWDFIKEKFDLDEGYDPYFDLVGINKKTGESVTIIDAKFENFSVTMSRTDPTTESLPFQACRVKFS